MSSFAKVGLIAMENMNRDDYYTYEEACQVLGVSMGHLWNSIGHGTFTPVHVGKGARKYLLKSDVDAMVGKQLFTRRKPKSQKGKIAKEFINDMGELIETGDINSPSPPTMIATVIMKMFHSFEVYANLLREMHREDNTRLDTMWQQAISATSQGLPLIASQSTSKEQAEIFSKQYLAQLESLKNLAT